MPPISFLKDIVNQWLEDEPFSLAAALSYYTLFSLAPLLTIAIGIAGFVFGRDAAQNQVVETLQGLVGRDSAQALQAIIEKAGYRPKAGAFSTALGILMLLFGAGGVVGHLQFSLNKIWRVAAKPVQTVWAFIRQRFVSFAMVLGVGFLLVVSLLVSALLSALATLMTGALGDIAIVGQLLDLAISLLVVTLLFAMIYKYLPDARIAWKDVWIGAALTSCLFALGKWSIGLYLGSTGVTSVYGAAGSLITVLLWVYYSSLIFFFGAEFTQVYAREYGSGLLPAVDTEATAAQAEKRPTGGKRTLNL
jgi:membrane protein